MLKNKRGDMSIATLILVLMALILVSASLYSFIAQTNNIKASILSGKFVESAYFKENQILFYSKQTGEKALIESYQDLARQRGLAIIDNFNKDKTETELSNIFIANFKSQWESYELKDKTLLRFKEKILESDLLANDFKININGDTVLLEFNNFGILGNLINKKGEEIINFIYRPSIKITINLNNAGLHSFNTIWKEANNCKNKENIIEIENCLKEKLYNFEVKVNENEKKEKLVSLLSKNKFFLGEEFKQIDLTFKL